MANAPEPGTRITEGHRRLLRLAAAATFLLVAMGGTVCVTGSTLGCPDWPGCYGRLVPPARADSIIEYGHRFLALLAAPLVLGAVWVGARRARTVPWLSRSPLLALVLFIAVAIFGAFAVLTGLPPLLAAVDLGSALLALALFVAPAVIADEAHRRGAYPGRLTLEGSFQRLAAATWGVIFLVLVLGVLVATPGSVARCLGWPLYGGSAVVSTTDGFLADLRIALSGAAVAGVVATWRLARRALPHAPSLVRRADVVLVLLVAELALGGWLVLRGSSPVSLVLYVVLAVGVWSALTALLAAAALPDPVPAAAAGAEGRERPGGSPTPAAGVSSR